MKDIDVRDALQRTFLKKFYFDDKSRVIPELDICNGEARIDIAVVNGHMHGFEIKSEQDTLTRLENQIAVYSKAFDYLTLVVAESHIDSAKKILPECWGIIRASMRHTVSLKIIRPARINRAVLPFALCQFLWKEELIALSSLYGISNMTSRSTKLEFCEVLSRSVKPQILAKSIRDTLKSRSTWRALRPSRQSDGSCRLKPRLSGFQVQPLA